MWCGVVWCGVVWCGVVWCGVVWCGVVWCGEASCDQQEMEEAESIRIIGIQIQVYVYAKTQKRVKTRVYTQIPNKMQIHVDGHHHAWHGQPGPHRVGRPPTSLVALDQYVWRGAVSRCGGARRVELWCRVFASPFCCLLFLIVHLWMRDFCSEWPLLVLLRFIKAGNLFAFCLQFITPHMIFFFLEKFHAGKK